MDVKIFEEQGKSAVTVMQISGHLDGQTYQSLIAQARKVIDAGAKNILLDLASLAYISSAGLVALHSIALMMRGEKTPNLEQGWSTLKSMDQQSDKDLPKNLKLLNPNQDITNVLEMVGFLEFFEVFTERQKALDSFE